MLYIPSKKAGVKDFNGCYHERALWPCDPTHFLSHKLSYTGTKFVKILPAVEELCIDHKLRCTDSRTERDNCQKKSIFWKEGRKEGRKGWLLGGGRRWGVRKGLWQQICGYFL